MLNSLFSQNVANVDVFMVLFVTCTSIVLGMIIALIYKLTGNANKNFLITISLLPVLVQSVIFLVNGNLGMGVAVAGTFSLVRFRSLPGTSKEILMVFFAMTIGIATGMGCVVYAFGLTVICSLVLLLLSKISLFNKDKNERHLNITIPEDMDYTSVFDDVLKKYTKSYELTCVKTTALGSMFELKYTIVMNDKVNQKEFIDELRIKNGNLKIVLTDSTDGMEL